MNTSLQKPRTIYLLLFGIMVLGLALRLYHLNFQSLWYDELHSIVPTDPKNTLSSLIEYCKRDQPPGYFVYLYGFFHVFGYNEVVGRLASVLLGVIAIPVMYFFGKEIRSESAGLAAALLTSLNYMHIYYSQELRFYSMVFLTTSLSFFYLIRAFKNGRNSDFALYVLFTATLLYTHYYGLVIFAVQVIIFFILLWYRQKSFALKAAISGTLVVILFLPWLPVIFNDLQIASFWIRKPEPTFLADYFYYYFGKDAFVTVVFVFLLFLFFRMLWDKNKQGPEFKPIYLLLTAWLVFSYLIPYIKSVIGQPMLYVRYTMVSLPVWILMISIGWDQIRNRKLKNWIIIAVTISMTLNLFVFRKHYFRIDKQQFREVSELIKEKNSRYPVYSVYAWHFNFYFKDYPVKIEEFDPANLSGVNTFWLLQAEFFTPAEKDEVIDTLQGQFEIVERHPFHKTEAVLLRRFNQ